MPVVVQCLQFILNPHPRYHPLARHPWLFLLIVPILVLLPLSLNIRRFITQLLPLQPPQVLDHSNPRHGYEIPRTGLSAELTPCSFRLHQCHQKGWVYHGKGCIISHWLRQEPSIKPALFHIFKPTGLPFGPVLPPTFVYNYSVSFPLFIYLLLIVLCMGHGWATIGTCIAF